MSEAAISEAQALRAGLAMLKQAPSERRMEFIQSVMGRAVGLYNSGQFDSADVLLESMEQEPLARQRVLHLRGVIALQRGEDDRALDLLDEAIQLDPAHGEAHANMGVLLLKTCQHPQALAAYAAALTLQPDNVAALFGLAQTLTKLDLISFAHDAFRDVLARAPDYAEPVVDFAALLNEMGRTDEAVELVQDALARHPEHANLNTMLFVCLFLRGDWRAAWPHNEWRFKQPEVSKHLLPTDRPRWQGEDLAGKTILLQYEQGFGDILQFVRYAPMVKARGGRVVLRAPQPLMSLMRTVAGVDEVFDNEAKVPAFDVQVPLVSLPLIFDTQSDTIPATVPYITPDPDRVAQWRARLNVDLGAHSGVSVGLVWQGNPAHPYDWRRSLQLDRLRPLLDCPGARFVSLQVGPGAHQVQSFAGLVVDPSAGIDTTSFADVAAIIANLDLVITIDSAIAHLAGAMGKPVWILLAGFSDWRWLRDREDTPWYPQARLFRQTEAGDWAGVVARVREALWFFAGASASSPMNRIVDPVTASALRMTAAPRASDPVLCDALFVEACRQHRAGHVERARTLFEQVLAFDPGHVNTLCNLGALELSMGRGARALAMLQVAVAEAPDLVPAQIVLADVLLDAKKIEQALAQYQKAIDLAPTSVAAQMAYAAALRKLSGTEAATGMEPDAVRRAMHQHYRKALELVPNDDGVHAQYALALCELGDIDQAMMHFLAATKINQQQSAEFYEALGRACAARGNAQGAEISLQHALMLDPQRVTAHCALGDFYLAQERPGEAETTFRSALAVNATHAAALRGYEQAQLARTPAATMS
ncbi:tetratricopeptide repeat protein [Bradyrhizobium prioriisuperbiae]|uniref:tetratricopeptide repeat protein n=1 Tax=Bradyrhizobium prioriisuperbiae TaxID=2854389 RepID=UPI0028ED418A|nr:tetratricopeptide repeat protein [Bradyrhizobium prioritasuperba]